ncbi:MAG TPA: hypothetical protein VGU27_03925, partial [Candidatus Eisenbacteria bacterium]|nr:hypothetical protein [Candidatus Eisenbacteria bacterium]
MSAHELPSVPALPDRARSFRWGYYAVRLLMAAVLLAAAAALPVGQGALDRLRYREGEIARERVVAPYDFRVQKDDATLRREQEEAALAVPPVFAVDARAGADVLARWSKFQGQALEILGDPHVGPAQRAERVRELGVPLDEDAAAALAAPGRVRRALADLGTWLQEVAQAGVVAEKKGGYVLGYRTVQLRDGDTETPVPASRLLERREALDLIERRAREAFGADDRGVALAVALAQPFVQ